MKFGRNVVKEETTQKNKNKTKQQQQNKQTKQTNYQDVDKKSAINKKINSHIAFTVYVYYIYSVGIFQSYGEFPTKLKGLYIDCK